MSAVFLSFLLPQTHTRMFKKKKKRHMDLALVRNLPRSNQTAQGLGWKDSLGATDGFQATRKVCQSTKSKARAVALVLGLKVQGWSGVTGGLWVLAPCRTARTWTRVIFPEDGSLFRNGIQSREWGEISQPLISTFPLISCQCLPMVNPLSNHKS